MNGVYVGDFGGADDSGNIQVALRQLRRPNADGLVGEADVKRIAVGFAVNGNRLDAELFAGTDDPQGNFTAIGYENFFKHHTSAQARTKKLLTAEIAENSQSSQRNSQQK